MHRVNPRVRVSPKPKPKPKPNPPGVMGSRVVTEGVNPNEGNTQPLESELARTTSACLASG